MSNARPPKPAFTLPTLTPMQQVTADIIKSIEQRIELLEEERASWEEDCKHVWVPFTKKGDPYTWCTWRKAWEICSHAFCLVCGESSARWYCVKSPTNICEYDEDEDPALDTCIHCGDPDERK